MAQRTFWNYKDDDLTFDLNFRELGIFEPGRYRGFDPVLSAGLTLTLNQLTTGADKTLSDGSTVTQFGIWNTKQGGIVTEDAAINLPISAGDATHPRIDLIIGQHQYVAIAGGTPAIYAVIEGTPAASPVAPALTIPAQQVILGYLYVPANMTDLNGAGVVYTQAAIPNYSNDATIPHTNTENEFTELQTVRGLEEYAGVATLDTAGAATVIFLTDGTSADVDRNIYILSTTSTPTIDYRVVSFNALPVPTLGNLRRFTLISPTVSLRFDAATFGRDYYLKAGSAVTIAVDSVGTIYFEEADEAALGRVNRFHKMQILKENTAGSSIATNLLDLSANGNIYNLANDATNDMIRGIQSSQSFDQGTTTSPTGGGFIWIIPNGNFPLRLQNLDFTVPAGYKPIWSPQTVAFQTVRTNEPILLVETALFWRVCKCQNGWYDVPVSLSFAGGGSVAINGTPTLRVNITENSVLIRFELNVTITGAITSMTLTLPLTWPVTQGACGLITAAGGFTPYETMFLITGGGGTLTMTSPTGFGAAAGKVMTFSGVFEHS